MENGDYPVSNSCPSHNVASKQLPAIDHTFFFQSLIVMSSSLVEFGMDMSDSQDDLAVSSKHQGDLSETSDEAHNPSGFSVEKHSNDFVVSNVVEFQKNLCKRCTDVE